MLWTTPAFLVLMVLLNLGAEFKHMKHSLDRNTLLRDSDWHDHPQASIETVFITTTITASTSSSTPTLVMEASSNVYTASPSSASPPRLSSSGTATEKVTLTLSPTSSQHPDENSLSLIHVLPFSWPPKLDLPPVAQQTVDTVLEGFAIVWQVFRRVYHYPLDPP